MTLRSTLTAAIASVAIAFTGVTPAAADPDQRDFLAALAGLAALAIIINNSRERDRPVPLPNPGGGGGGGGGGQNGRLPAHCAIDIQTKYGWQKVYTEQCLWRAGYTRNLPDRCKLRVRGENGWNQVYTEYCLRKNGY